MFFNKKKKVDADDVIENIVTLFTSMVLLHLSLLSFGTFLPDLIGMDAFLNIKFYVKIAEFALLVLFLNEIDTLLFKDKKISKKNITTMSNAPTKKQKLEKSRLRIKMMGSLLEDLEVHSNIESLKHPKVTVLRGKGYSGSELGKIKKNKIKDLK